METLHITTLINVQILLSPTVFDECQFINRGLILLEQRKHDFITLKYSYKIHESEITFYSVPLTEIQTIISILNF